MDNFNDILPLSAILRGTRLTFRHLLRCLWRLVNANLPMAISLIGPLLALWHPVKGSISCALGGLMRCGRNISFCQRLLLPALIYIAGGRHEQTLLNSRGVLRRSNGNSDLRQLRRPKGHEMGMNGMGVVMRGRVLRWSCTGGKWEECTDDHQELSWERQLFFWWCETISSEGNGGMNSLWSYLITPLLSFSSNGNFAILYVWARLCIHLYMKIGWFSDGW